MQGSMTKPSLCRPSARSLLAWYDRHRRALPWRAAPGQRPDPYRVWLAEIMLQQTTVAAAIPYYRRFIARWPRLADLAAADEAAVLTAWSGLGYYARARRLHASARRVVALGRFPDTESELRALPGVGPASAAAIASIAFDRPAVASDGNVLRVMSRLFAVAAPLPKAKPVLLARARSLAPARRPGDYTQAIMELGQTVCRPRAPDCARCPWRRACRAYALGTAAAFPVPVPRRPRPRRHGIAFLATLPDGAVLLRRRPSGLLGGMAEAPSTPWRARPWTLSEARRHAPVRASWRRVGRVEHSFSHFNLVLDVVGAEVKAGHRPEGYWCPPDGLGAQPLPSVMRKVLELGQRG